MATPPPSPSPTPPLPPTTTTTWHLEWVPDVSFYNRNEKPKRCYLASPLHNWQYEHPDCAMHITTLFEYRGYDRTLPVFGLSVACVPVGVAVPFKLIVDGEWYYDPRYPTLTDPLGNINNVITLKPASSSCRGQSQQCHSSCHHLLH